MDSETKRSSFSGKIGFILAAAGSAVGLGNIWRFPYLAAKYGGGIFLLVYIALSVTFGFALMVAEIAIGRKTQQSPLGAFKSLDNRFSWVGVLATIIPILILPYYSVIGGWVIKYAVGFMTGGMNDMAADYVVNGESLSFFEIYTAQTVAQPIIWFVIFVTVTTFIVIFGVQKGVEKVSKVMMPALVFLMVFIVIYSMFTVKGEVSIWDGLVYYLKPDFSNFSIMTVVAAMGQLFYSMSLAMGIMITFGSYMKKDISIEKSTHQVEIFDTGIAILAGLMIVPAVFVFSGGDEAALGKGAGLMFITLPKVFTTMKGGAFIGFVFFVMVLLAALTSAISLMETIVAVFMDKLGFNRTVSCLIVLGICLVFGLPSSLGYSVWGEFKILGMQFLDLFDFISNSILMPIVAFSTCIFIGFVLKPSSLIDEVEISGPFKAKRLFSVMIKYIAPIFIIAILISSVLDVFGVVKI